MKRNAGFTLPELLVAMTLTVLMTGLVLTFMVDFWRGTATLQNDEETLVTRDDAADRLREALNPGSHLLSQNSIADSNAEVPDPSDPSGTHWLIIHAIPGTTNLPASGSYTPLFYFNAPSVDSSKNFIMNGAQPYDDQFVLYMNGSTGQVLLRTLVNPSATNDYLKTSCPAAIASSSCPADEVIASNVTAAGLRYFSLSGNTIDYTSSTDPTTGLYNGPDFPVVEVAEITLHLKRTSVISNGNDTVNETIVRVALRN